MKRVKRSTFSTMAGSKLNHLLMILIYNEERDKMNIKILTNKLIKEKESRIATLGLYQFWTFACFSLFIVTAKPVSSQCFLSIPLRSSKNLKVFLLFQWVLKENSGTKWVNVTTRGLPRSMYKTQRWLLDARLSLYTYLPSTTT